MLNSEHVDKHDCEIGFNLLQVKIYFILFKNNHYYCRRSDDT